MKSAKPTRYRALGKETKTQAYIRNQEDAEKQVEQMQIQGL